MKQELNLPDHVCGAVMYFDRLQGRNVLPAHHHDELEVNLVLSGTGKYVVEDDVLGLQPQSMIWLFPEQEHQLIESSPDFIMWVGVFKPELLNEVRESGHRFLRMKAPTGRFLREILRPESRELERIFGEALRRRENTDLCNATLHYLLMKCVAAYSESLPGEVIGTLHPSIARVVHRMAEKDEGKSVDALAKEAGLSRSHFLRLFRSQIGLTVTAYRNRLRVERYLQLYGEGERMNQTEAALEAGFGSYAQFLRTFKGLHGVSPRKYRNSSP